MANEDPDERARAGKAGLTANRLVAIGALAFALLNAVVGVGLAALIVAGCASAGCSAGEGIPFAVGGIVPGVIVLGAAWAATAGSRLGLVVVSIAGLVSIATGVGLALAGLESGVGPLLVAFALATVAVGITLLAGAVGPRRRGHGSRLALVLGLSAAGISGLAFALSRT